MSEYAELIEQYRKKLLEGTANTDYSAIYKNSAEALIAAQNSAYQSRIADLEAELPEIKKTYDNARANAYVNAKLSAINDNEALAALGLAGNLHHDAKSGVSESSRIAQDNALRSDINLLNNSEIADERGVKNKIDIAAMENDQEIAAILKDYSAQMAEYEKEQRALEQEKLAYELKLQQFEAEKKQTAVTNALKELDAFGRIMTQEAADALGIPVGTMNYTAQLAADKAAAKSSGRGRSGSSKSSKSSAYNDVYQKAQSYLSIPTNTYSASYNAALYGIKVSALPAYRANEYLKGQVRNKTITEKQMKTIKASLGI